MGNSNSLVRYVKNKAYGHQEVKILMCGRSLKSIAADALTTAVHVIMLYVHGKGLDAVGKSTILYKLKLGEVVTTVPTIGKTGYILLFPICQ